SAVDGTHSTATMPLHTRRVHRRQPLLQSQKPSHLYRTRNSCLSILALAVVVSHALHAHNRHLKSVSCLPKGNHALLAHFLHGRARSCEVFAWIKFGAISLQTLPNRTRHCEATIGIDIDLPHPCSNGTLNLLYRHTVGLLNGTPMGIDHI